ncbi:hypothetical protein PsYK624_104480 [Phanerochaete sordida]|uniref:Secreted protein n=1 Tax=Phanerochaete sordida TaxID=48140 RepID=A0A9P3GIM4_9APHY|nr:hypothetical protein PsYK624_104480 [Phanerochaete sordida]
MGTSWGCGFLVFVIWDPTLVQSFSSTGRHVTGSSLVLSVNDRRYDADRPARRNICSDTLLSSSVHASSA